MNEGMRLGVFKIKRPNKKNVIVEIHTKIAMFRTKFINAEVIATVLGSTKYRGSERVNFEL